MPSIYHFNYFYIHQLALHNKETKVYFGCRLCLKRREFLLIENVWFLYISNWPPIFHRIEQSDLSVLVGGTEFDRIVHLKNSEFSLTSFNSAKRERINLSSQGYEYFLAISKVQDFL